MAFSFQPPLEAWDLPPFLELQGGKLTRREREPPAKVTLLFASEPACSSCSRPPLPGPRLGTFRLAPSVFQAPHPAWGFPDSERRTTARLQGSDAVAPPQVAGAGEPENRRNRWARLSR